MLIFPARLTLVARNFAPYPFRFLGIITLKGFTAPRTYLNGVAKLITLISVSEVDITTEAEFASSFTVTKFKRHVSAYGINKIFSSLFYEFQMLNSTLGI